MNSIKNKYWLGLALFLGTLVFGMSYRAYIVNHTHSLLAGCEWCFIIPTLAHDFLLLALIIGLIGLILMIKPSKWKFSFGIILILITFFFWLDIIIYKTLNYRVRIADVLLFSKETHAIWTFLQALKHSPKDFSLVITSAISIIAGIFFIWHNKTQISTGKHLLLTAAIAGLAYITVTRHDLDYVFNDTVMNFLEINAPSGGDKNYSSAETLKLNTTNIIQTKISPQAKINGDVILLVVESLSGYHSNLLLPSNRTYTPFLDRIAKNNSYFSNFFANGFTTDGGLISLMTGRAPIPSIGRYRSVDAFQGFDCVEETFPLLMRSNGYETNFFSNGSLEFTNLGGWAKSIGFDYIEGPDHEYYQNWEKGIFGAVEDRALFDRVLEWMSERDQPIKKPFAAVLMTHSTHPPFVDPVTKSNIETEVYQYMDKSVESFYNKLTQQGFFSNGGILLITGDHRGYTPISINEHTAFGESARARIPFIAIGNHGLPQGEIKSYAQQVDLLNSMKFLLGGNSFSIPSNRGIFFSTPAKEPSFILHASGKERDQIKVFYPNNKQGTIKLNGDNTSWQGEKPENWQVVLNAIAIDRINRGNAAINYVDYLYMVTFDPSHGKDKFASGSNCRAIYPAPNF